LNIFSFILTWSCLWKGTDVKDVSSKLKINEVL
jgi:hypothetical protein